jgi:CheY-like chemotaxis protein
MKILVVEDDPEWQSQLKHMYANVVRDDQVSVAGTGVEAMDTLKARKFDILSLDINLGPRGCSGGPPIHGIDVLKAAKRLKAAKAVVAISGCLSDPLDPIIEDPVVRKRVHIDLPGLLDEVFSARHSGHFYKSPCEDVAAQIEVWRKQITLLYLESLVAGGAIPHPYIVRVIHTNHWRIRIQSKQRGHTNVWIDGSPFGEYLWKLSMQWMDTNDPVVTQEDTARILAPQLLKRWKDGNVDLQHFQSGIAGYVERMSEYLASRLLIPEHVIESAGRGKGYKLASSVADVEGLRPPVRPAPGEDPDGPQFDKMDPSSEYSILDQLVAAEDESANSISEHPTESQDDLQDDAQDPPAGDSPEDNE